MSAFLVTCLECGATYMTGVVGASSPFPVHRCAERAPTVSESFHRAAATAKQLALQAERIEREGGITPPGESRAREALRRAALGTDALHREITGEAPPRPPSREVA